jgi:hypothetical protein
MSAVAANAAVLGRREVRVVKSCAVFVMFCSLLDTTCLTFNHMAVVPICCILQRTLLVSFYIALTSGSAFTDFQTLHPMPSLHP